MVSRLKIIESKHLDPYWNLALEEELLHSVASDECILYLWQNRNTVVIGRNQNPWVECRTELLNEENANLARRLSGGGAVYHDVGNLNFTFLMSHENFNIERQLRVIQSAIGKFGVTVTFSGRNDLLVADKKFSGNAFYHTSGKSYHHGTILIDTDSDKLSRYLSPSKAKLQAKGVSSVRSRIINLSEIIPEITIENAKENLIEAFSDIYDAPVSKYDLTTDQLLRIEESQKKFSSWDWIYGAPLPFSFTCEDRFSWGSFQLLLQVNKGIITEAKVYTDAMQWKIASEIENCLSGIDFSVPSITDAIIKCALEPAEISEDICTLIGNQNI